MEAANRIVAEVQSGRPTRELAAQVGESYDLIIAVDGWRVTNFFDFEERMRNIQPGELVYLSVVRNGKRIAAITEPGKGLLAIAQQILLLA